MKTGADHHRFKGDDITYITAHKRVYALRGKATEWSCTFFSKCGNQAANWAYAGGSPAEKREVIDGYSVPYSTDPDAYMPMCRQCHTRYDHDR